MIKKWISRTFTGMVLTLIIIIALSIVSNSMNSGMRIQYLGNLFEFSSSKTGIIVFFGLPGVYLIVIQMWKMFRLLTQAENIK